MTENLEVFFCDLCNTSVPQPHIDSGVAVRVHGKVVGACCLKTLRAPGEGNRRSGTLGAMVVLLAALGGLALFFDWRLVDETGEIHRLIGGLDQTMLEQQDRLRAVDEQLGKAPTGADVARVTEGVHGVVTDLGEIEARLQAGLTGLSGRNGEVAARVESLVTGQQAQASQLADFDRELRRLGQELAAGLARPRPVSPPAEGMPIAAATSPSAPEPLRSDLSAELAHAVAKLKDADPGTRFEAVDKLLQSRNPEVLSSLLEAAKDSDPFVRRLTVEGLGDFRKSESVDVLLVALSDAESIVRHAAYAALRKLTSQTFAFDPDAGKDERRSAQRRWQDWWHKNRASF